MKPILLSVAGNPENQDRGLVLEEGGRTVLCVADGAGGRSGGAEAAEMAIQLVRQGASALSSADSCSDLLRGIDAAVCKDAVAGETTCTLAVVTREKVFGASVGDSAAWLIVKDGGIVDLTRSQQRKPFIGSGCAWPVPFTHVWAGQPLLLATDGLIKYTSAERIASVCLEHSPESAAQRLVELVRYPSGALPDDVTVIVAAGGA